MSDNQKKRVRSLVSMTSEEREKRNDQMPSERVDRLAAIAAMVTEDREREKRNDQMPSERVERIAALVGMATEDCERWMDRRWFWLGPEYANLTDEAIARRIEYAVEIEIREWIEAMENAREIERCG